MPTKEAVVEEFRKQSIADAAMRVVSRKGMHDVTVQEIADEAGVAKGTVYIYFDSRDAILTFAMDAACEKLMQSLETACRSARTFREILTQRVRTQLQHFEERRDFFRMYLAMSEPFGERRLRQHPTYTAYLAQLERLLREAIARGEVRHTRVERLAVSIASVVRDVLLHRIIEKEPPPIDEDAAYIVDFVMRGIGKS